MKDYLIAGIGLLTTISSSLVTFFFTRKKYKTEVDTNIINNMEKALEFYEKLSVSTNERLDDLIKKYDKMNEENVDMKVKIEILELQINKLLELSCKVIDCSKRKKAKKNNENN